jgi:hypothetical protein
MCVVLPSPSNLTASSPACLAFPGPRWGSVDCGAMTPTLLVDRVLPRSSGGVFWPHLLSL